MAISKIIVHTCSGGPIEETMQAMIEMAERYKCDVEADINGTPVTIGPSRLNDVMRLWEFYRTTRK